MTRIENQCEDIFVHLMDFGKDVTAKEAVTPNADGSYTVFVNARYSYEQQIQSALHAIKHIRDTDFSKDNIQTIEAEAHGVTSPISEKTVEETRPERIRKNSQIRLKKLQRGKKKRQKELKERQEFIEFLMNNVPSYAKEHSIF